MEILPDNLLNLMPNLGHLQTEVFPKEWTRLKKLQTLVLTITMTFLQDLHLDQWNISMPLLELLQKLVEEVDRTIHPVKVHMLGEDQTVTKIILNVPLDPEILESMTKGRV